MFYTYIVRRGFIGKSKGEIGLTDKERGKATEEAAEVADRPSTWLWIKHK